jgi:MerR family redox-sensitive transcriptional activator SoxR
MDSPTLTIGEVAQQAGIHTSAIRYYESMGLLPPPKRVNGRRRYEPDVIKRLGVIQVIRQAGFGIRELQALFGVVNEEARAAAHWKNMAAGKIVELDAAIERAQARKVWLNRALQSECNGVDGCSVTAREICL